MTAEQDSLKLAFRQSELQRRAERRRRLILQIQNEGFLFNEELTPAERAITEEALARIKLQNIQYALKTEPATGYWKKLWLALTGRL